MYSVLFVEDDKAISYIVSVYKIWEALGFKIKDIAENGQEALQKIHENSYDLIITDIRMPIMDGLELIRAVKRMKKSPVIIFASTYSEFAYAKEGMRLGVLDYIEKPYSELKIETVLKSAKFALESNNSNIDNGFEDISIKVKELSNRILENSYSPEEIICEFDKLIETQGASSNKTYTYMIKRIRIAFFDKYPWIKDLENIKEVKEEVNRDELMEVVVYISKIIEYYRLDCQDDMIKDCCMLLIENIRENNIVDKITEQLGISKDYLNKMFKNKTGMTIHKYLQMMKIQRAKVLLKETKLKIYEISEDLGYSTVDYFTKLFQEYTGQTPTQFKRDIYGK